MKAKQIGSWVFVALLSAVQFPAAGYATSTYTQDWFETPSSNLIMSATSTSTWAAVDAGRTVGPRSRMDFAPTSGAQTVRLTLSLGGGAVDVSGMTCQFRAGNIVASTSGSGSSLVTVSTNSTNVVCDLTFAAGSSVFGFELTSGSGGQQGFIWVGRESGISTETNSQIPAPAKYAGPEFSGLSVKPVAAGSSSVLEGKRLNEVSSITIGGKSATFTATATELKLDVPTDLAPGIYDLVIQSAAGKLTHMNAVRVQAPRRSLSITTVAEGRVTQNQFAEHALIASMQPRDLNRVRCIVNGPNLATARAQAEQLCAAVRGANRHIETSIVEPRSTVRDNKVYSRVTYGWN